MKITPRYSLLNLFLLTTIVGVSVGLYVVNQRKNHLESRIKVIVEENCSYRDALGLFEVEDTKQIHAIKLPKAGGHLHAYRIYLPSGKKYRLCYRANEIPRQQVPIPTDTRTLESGDHLVSIEIRHPANRLSGEIVPYATVVTSRADHSGDELNPGSGTLWWTIEFRNNWLRSDKGKTQYQLQGIGRELEIHDATQALAIYRARAYETVVTSRDAGGKPDGWTVATNEENCNGFMVWIEPMP